MEKFVNGGKTSKRCSDPITEFIRHINPKEKGDEIRELEPF